jgi:hypothetical protein
MGLDKFAGRCKWTVGSAAKHVVDIPHGDLAGRVAVASTYQEYSALEGKKRQRNLLVTWLMPAYQLIDFSAHRPPLELVPLQHDRASVNQKTATRRY